MPEWAIYLSSFTIILLFLLGVFGLASSSYGDWVRGFYAKRARLQTLFGNGKSKNE